MLKVIDHTTRSVEYRLLVGIPVQTVFRGIIAPYPIGIYLKGQGGCAVGVDHHHTALGNEITVFNYQKLDATITVEEEKGK